MTSLEQVVITLLQVVPTRLITQTVCNKLVVTNLLSADDIRDLTI